MHIANLLLLLFTTVAFPAFASDAKIKTDEFDGATRVWIDPHGLNCGMNMICPLLGARWTSKAPGAAVLAVEVVNTYSAITGVRLNIDGSFLDLQPIDEPTRFKNNGGAPGVAPVRYSTKDYLIPLELVEAILAAKDVKVRVSTADGFVDGALIGGKKNSKAAGALGRFWKLVPQRPAASAPTPAAD
jgi:hypothetical protein